MSEEGVSIGGVKAVLTADVGDFDKAFDKAPGQVDKLAKSIEDTEKAITSLGGKGTESLEEIQEHAGLLHEAFEGAKEGWEDLAKGFAVATLASAGIEKLGEAVKELIVESVKAAAQAQMTGVMFKAAFGPAADEVSEWSEKTAKALGRSQDDMMKAATSAKIMADALGVDGEEAIGMSEALTKMATEMSIARGVPLPEAMHAIEAGLHGAGRGLYEYGIALNSTTQNAKALELGLGDQYSKLTQAQQAQVNYSIIMQGASKVQEDAAAAAGTLNNQIDSLKSHFEELQAHMAGKFIDDFTAIVHVANEAVTAFDELDQKTKGWSTTLLAGPIAMSTKLINDLKDTALELAGVGEDDKAAARARAMDNEITAANEAQEKHKAALLAEAEAFNAKKKEGDDKEIAELKAWSAQQAALNEAAAAKRHQLVQAALDAEARSTQQEIQKRLAVEQQILKLHEASSALDSKAALDVLEAHEKVAEADASRAQKALTDVKTGGGGYDQIKQAQAMVDAAYLKVIAAAETTTSAEQKQLDGLNFAIQNAQQQSDAFMDGTDQRLKAEEEVERLKKQRLELENKQRHDEQDLEQKKLDNIERLRQVNQEAAKFYSALGQSLGSKALGSAGGIVNSAVQGAQVAGPAGAIAGAGVGLLEQSSQFRKLQAEVDKITQEIADVVGSALEPLLPVIEDIDRAIQPVLNALKPILKALGEDVARALAEALASIQPFIGPLADSITAIAPLVDIFFRMSALVEKLAALMDPLTYAMKALGAVAPYLAAAVQFAADAIGGAWDAIVSALQWVLNGLAHILPAGAGDAMHDLSVSLEGMKYSTTKAADAMAAAIQALDDGAKVLTDGQHALIQARINSDRATAAVLEQMSSILPGVGLALEAEANRLQGELNSTAAFGSAIDMAERGLNVLQKQTKDTTASLAAMQATVDQTLSASSSRTQGDSHDIAVLSAAIAQAQQNGASTDVVQQLQTELAAAQAKYAIDLLQLAVDQDAAMVAHDDAAAQLAQLAEQTALAKVQLDYAQGLTDADQQTMNDWAAVWGAAADETAANADSVKDQAKQKQDEQALVIAQATQMVANTKATTQNTAVTQQLVAAQNLNVPAMFKVAQAMDAATNPGGPSGGSHGSSSAAKAAGIGAGLAQRISNVLAGGTYNEVVVNGGVHFHNDSSDASWKSIKGKIKQDKQERTGSSARDLQNRWSIKDQG